MRAFGPGRVNLIGEHTDYNGGLALPFATDRGVTVEASPRPDGRIVARALDLGEDDDFAAAEPPPARGWRAFVRGMVAELGVRDGFTLEISGDIPRGAGLSSSAALEVALGLALAGEPPDRVTLAKLCSRVENSWVGAQTGLLDQLASLCSTPGHALRIDFATLGLAPVALHLDGARLAVVDSGAAHDLSGSEGYNERRAECGEAARRLGLEFVAQATEAQAASLPAPLDRRVRHVIEEDERVEATIAALAAGDAAEVGRRLDASHASLRDLYEASVPEVEAAVDRLKSAGALGARMIGGGFGGSVLGLFGDRTELPGDAVELAPGQPARLLQG